MFAEFETSVDGGRPIYLYRFVLGSNTWRYTSADEDVTAGGFTWTAAPISDMGISQTGESAQDALTITMDSQLSPALAFRGAPPTGAMVVTILRTHEGDPDGEVITAYVGEVSAVNTPTPNQAVLTCETLAATMRRAGLRLGWQRTCPYVLYDQLTCKVNKDAHAVTGTVDSISAEGVVIVSEFAALPAGTLSGGFITWVDPLKGNESRTIEIHHGSPAGGITILGTTEGITVGLSVTAYPGCARTMAACTAFSNLPNYGGFPHLPGETPFGDKAYF